MCLECGCGLNPLQRWPKPGQRKGEAIELDVQQSLLAANDATASANRTRLRQHGIFSVNLMSSPGAGKTALLQTLIPLLAPLRCAVIVGDLQTDNDARCIRQTGAPTIQITTGQACHLDAAMVAGALDQLELSAIDLLFIENVGNLVCPASFDLGEDKRIALLSVCEGEDKPAKYPTLFFKADLMLITKADLLPHLPQFSPTQAETALRQLANNSPCLTISSFQPDSLSPLIDWLRNTRGQQPC